MRIPRPLSIAVVCVAAIAMAAAAANAAPERPPQSPATPNLAAVPDIAFYVAHGDPGACGSGCSEWIAAEGKIDVGAPERLRRVLTKLGRRRLPIFFHSPGGLVGPGIALGRLIRERRLETGVGRTVPSGCDREKAWDKSCEGLKRSGRELSSEFDVLHAMCNSACLFGVAGGATRLIPPGVKLGIHDTALTRPLSAVLIANAKKYAHVQIEEHLREMGIDDGLYKAILTVPNSSIRLLERDELVRFGIDRRKFGETPWQFVDHPKPAILKVFFTFLRNEQPQYRTGFVRLDCPSGHEMRIVLGREHVTSDTSTSRPSWISIGGNKINLAYPTSAPQFDTRSMWLGTKTFEALGSDAAFEIPVMALSPADESADRIQLSLDGFSRVYARLQDGCNHVPAPAQMTISTSNANPSSTANCQPGGDPLKCVQGLPGPAASNGTKGVQTTAIKPDFTQTAQSNSAPKSNDIKTPSGVQTVELTRAVPVGRKLSIDFIYAINPDCSSMGLASVRVIAQPEHGKAAVENGTAFTNFPAQNQRYECNKRKSEGIVIAYEPSPGFTGPDAMTLDIIYPTGLEVKRHYAIEVK